MNTARSASLLLSVFLVAVPSVSQITITASDVNAQLTVGNTLTNRSDTLTTTLNIGSPGASSWNFSLLGTTSTQVLKSVLASTTPFIGQFSGATHSFETTVTIQGITGTVYQYLKLGTNLENLGNLGTASTQLGTLQLKTTNAPAEIVYGLPSTFGTTWNTAYTATQVISLGPLPLSTTNTTHNAAYMVDAYGPMTLPGGAVHDVLRIRKDNTTSNGRVVSYTFLAKNGASVLATALDPNAPDSGSIGVTSVSWSAPITTDIGTELEVVADFKLEQNYPNPFNPGTTIEYAVGRSGFVTLKVYDVLGSEIATLVNDVKEPGRYSVDFDGRNLSSGVYFYRMTSGNFHDMKKLLLLR